jgi:hypothetical protein
VLFKHIFVMAQNRDEWQKARDKADRKERQASRDDWRHYQAERRKEEDTETLATCASDAESIKAKLKKAQKVREKALSDLAEAQRDLDYYDHYIEELHIALTRAEKSPQQ